MLTAYKTGTEAALTYAGTTHREKESIIYTMDAVTLSFASHQITVQISI